jgi:hypothetical protein
MTDDQFISVAAILPFWRYAVGPKSGHSPAVPFYRIAPAVAFFEEAKRDLPWAGCLLYKRTMRGIVTVKEYRPKPSCTPECGETACPECPI